MSIMAQGVLKSQGSLICSNIKVEADLGMIRADCSEGQGRVWEEEESERARQRGGVIAGERTREQQHPQPQPQPQEKVQLQLQLQLQLLRCS